MAGDGMTDTEVLGTVGLLLFLAAGFVLAVIVFQRLADRLGAWMHARRAISAFGSETTSAQEDRAARDLGGGEIAFSYDDTTDRSWWL